MVSGAKNRNNNKKQKLVFAKDQKQAVLAIVVMALFLLTTLYNSIKVYNENHPDMSNTMAKNEKIRIPNSLSRMKKGMGEQQPEDLKNLANSKPIEATQNIDQETPPSTPPPPPPSNTNGLIWIVLGLILAGAGYFAVKTYKENYAGASARSTKNNNLNSSGDLARGKNNNKNQKTGFAKDQKQAVLAIVVIALFLLTTLYTSIKVYNENHPDMSNTMAKNEKIRIPNSLAQMRNQMKQQQQDNLKSLADAQPNNSNPNMEQGNTNIYSEAINLQNPGTPSDKMNAQNNPDSQGDIEIIPVKQAPMKKNGKMIMVSVVDSGRSNPFLPASENYSTKSGSMAYLTSPPETLPTNSDAGKVMTTTISGILFDKYNPSAIINIEGSDYLVKKGDVVNNYKILAINKDQVMVQLGKNMYKAGVGEILSATEGLNYNVIANLNKKFGGNDVSINVKRKNY